MRLSVTKISNYLDCPRKYWYTYEMKVETKKSEGYYFGSAVHEGLENHYTGKDPMQGVANSLFGKKTKITDEAKEGVDPYKLHSEAKRIFEIYPKKATKFQPLFVEHWFDVPLINPDTKEELPANFVGKIDLITVDGNIIDHKTATGFSNGFFDDDNEFQASGYVYAYLQMFKKMPNSFIFNTIIRENTKRGIAIDLKTLYPTMEDVFKFFNVCKSTIKAIENKETSDHVNTRHCRYCPFKDICPKKI